MPLLPTRLVVKIVKVELAEVLPGETEAGEKEQLAPAGSPDAHVRATDEPKSPLDAVTETV